MDGAGLCCQGMFMEEMGKRNCNKHLTYVILDLEVYGDKIGICHCELKKLE